MSFLIRKKILATFFVRVQQGEQRGGVDVIIGQEQPTESLKLTGSAKVKNQNGTLAVRATVKVGRCRSCTYCEADLDLAKGKRRSKSMYPRLKDEDNNHHQQTNPN